MAKEFTSVCAKIESAKNYYPYIDNKELMSLILNPNGSSKYFPTRRAMGIQNSDIALPWENGGPIGKLYQIKIALKGPIDNSPIAVWHVDDSLLIFVSKNGSYSVHFKENIKKGKFDYPLKDLKIDDVLGNEESLYYNEKIMAEELVKQLENNLNNGFREAAFKKINPLIEINEKRLNLLINELEKKGSALAYFVCGLLMEGRIINLIDEEKDIACYMEKRVHDAITFYMEAEKDPKIKPLVDYILWEMKTVTNTYPSVQKRLAEFDVTPNFVESYHLYRKDGHKIIAPLYRSLGVFKQKTEKENKKLQLTSLKRKRGCSTCQSNKKRKI